MATKKPSTNKTATAKAAAESLDHGAILATATQAATVAKDAAKLETLRGYADRWNEGDYSVKVDIEALAA